MQFAHKRVLHISQNDEFACHKHVYTMYSRTHTNITAVADVVVVRFLLMHSKNIRADNEYDFIENCNEFIKYYAKTNWRNFY